MRKVESNFLLMILMIIIGIIISLAISSIFILYNELDIRVNKNVINKYNITHKCWEDGYYLTTDYNLIKYGDDSTQT